ncbi:MAG: hypothetical protein ACI9KE_006045 [Polyangiales bacterium]
MCDEAQAHVNGCFGDSTPPLSADSCDVSEAETLLSQSCEDLSLGLGDRKSDLFNGRLAAFGCRIGLYRFCEVPMCDAAADEPLSELPVSSYVDASECAAALSYEGCGACEYYACREAEAQCGDDGYLIAFAEKYCERYRLVTEQRISLAGQAWLRRVRRCLVEELEASGAATCEDIERSGFDSHPLCYTETGFCDLSAGDWVGVLNTIDPGDLRLREIFVTGHQCLSEWLR